MEMFNKKAVLVFESHRARDWAERALQLPTASSAPHWIAVIAPVPSLHFVEPLL